MKPTIVLALTLLSSILPAHAATIRWNLLNVAFADGGAATGYFVVDTINTSILVDYDVFTTGSAFSDERYTPATAASPAGVNGNSTVTMYSSTYSNTQGRALQLWSSVYLPTNTGTYPLITNSPAAYGSYEVRINNFAGRFVSSGYLTTNNAATPEPSAAVLVCIGLLGLPLASRLRKKVR